MLILQSRIFRTDLKANPLILYCFGDNEERWGLGGQAKEMRGEPNAIGIATLKAPGRFWNDAYADWQCSVLLKDFDPVFKALGEGRLVVWPSDGVGTGLADLANRSPVTFAYLKTLVSRLFTFRHGPG